MNIKFTGLVLGTALSAFAFSACSPAANTNTTNVNGRVNSNTAVVVNSNNSTVVSTTNNNVASGNGNWTWNANITEEEYEKTKDEYAKKAKDAGSTIGNGAKDGWLWTKTRAALATTDELRESTINVDVDNGVVTLKGTVANAAQKTKAEQVAKGVKDVKSVTNSLTVSATDSVTKQMTDGDTKGNSNTANKSAH